MALKLNREMRETRIATETRKTGSLMAFMMMESKFGKMEGM
jgi:hypothetical protein